MGNVYMEADQVRFKDSTYRNIQEGLAAALEGGGGGGTTVVANPEGSATADLAKLQVGTAIYGIPAEAGDISYDNTSSGLTADDVQEAIDELNTGLSSVTELIPSGATSSNKLATESDIPDAVTGNPSGSATAGNLTKLQIGSDVYNVPSGSGGSVLIRKVPIAYTDFTLITDVYKYEQNIPSAISSEILSADIIQAVLVFHHPGLDLDFNMTAPMLLMEKPTGTTEYHAASWGNQAGLSEAYISVINNITKAFFMFTKERLEALMSAVPSGSFDLVLQLINI